MKCNLLYRKTSAPVTITATTDRMSSRLETTKDDGTTVNALHHSREDSVDNTSLPEREERNSMASKVADNVRNLLMSKTDFKDGVASPVNSVNMSKVDKVQEESKVAEKTPVSKEDKFVNAITRLSRLNTDLANERNLLAWARTALASARTFLAFIGVAAVTDFGKASRQVCYVGFAVMSIYIILQGTERYNKIKRIVYLKDPPPNFDRLTNAPLPICLSLLFLLALMSVSFDQWED